MLRSEEKKKVCACACCYQHAGSAHKLHSRWAITMFQYSWMVWCSVAFNAFIHVCFWYGYGSLFRACELLSVTCFYPPPPKKNDRKNFLHWARTEKISSRSKNKNKTFFHPGTRKNFPPPFFLNVYIKLPRWTLAIRAHNDIIFFFFSLLLLLLLLLSSSSSSSFWPVVRKRAVK